MVSNTELNDNYKAISQLPIVKQTLKCVSRLTKENKALVKENAMLKKMIDRLFDRQSVSTKTCCCGCSNANRPIPDIQIKKEKVVVDMTHNTTSSHTDENIVYELSEDTDNNLDNKPIPYIIEEEDVEVEVEESAEEEEVEVEVDESDEEEEVEVEVEESDEEEEVEVEVEESDEEEDEEVYEITIKNKSYYTSNETDGPIYAITDDEDIGDQIGEFVKGKPTFYKKTNK